MLHHEKISFKKLQEKDIPLLASWLEQPHVSKWWPVLEKNEDFDHFLQRIRSKDTFGYIVSFDEQPIGYIQYYYVDPAGEKTGKRFSELPVGTVGTDQFIGDLQYVGRGIGTRMVKNFIAYIGSIEPNVRTIIVDPDPLNAAAIRCYEKVGFKKVGVYTMAYGECLLMRYDI